MRKLAVQITIFLCLLVLSAVETTGTVSAAYPGGIPDIGPDGAKWRIGYCESENFITYTETLVAVVKGLEESGWVNNLAGFDSVAATGDSGAIWEWLATREVSPYLEFAGDAFYNLREQDVRAEDIVNRLNDRRDPDLLLAMGAQAGYLLSNFLHDTDIFVFAASNAVRSGIIDSVHDSGKDHVWAHMDEQRFERQIKAFYDILRFRKLGMVYEDSDNARIYSAVNEVEALAREKGYEIVRYYVREPRTPEEYPGYYREVQAAYNKLATEVDAMYVTIASLESTKLPQLFQPFYDHKIPVLSQLGNIEVKNGALLTVSVMDAVNIGRFGADNIIKCLQGAKPRDLEQSFQSSPQITLNAEVARKLDYKLPFELVMVLDEAYQTIGSP
ncbi:MAG: ABC transporter substrate binding protein [Peptococcaceae bacterium]